MSDALITSLNATVERLQRELAETRAESKKHRIAKRDAAGRVAELEQAVRELADERDDLTARVEATPGEQAARVAELEGQIKLRDVKDAFRGVEGQLGDKVTLEKLWKFNDFDPAQADPAALKVDELVKGWRDAAPGLFKGETPTPAPGGAQRPRLETSLPAGRGAPDANGSMFRVRRSDAMNPEWMAVNQGKVAEANRAGTLQWVDG